MLYTIKISIWQSCADLKKISLLIFVFCIFQGHSKAHSHNLENLKCRVCGKVFSLPCRLKDHLIKHTGEKPHICSICQKGFRSSSKLKRHMAIHTNDRRYQCSICEKKFLRSETLKDHMDTHGSNLIKCKGKSYSRKFNASFLLMFSFLVCMEYFSKEELSRHAKTHKEVKPPEPSPQIDPNPSGDVLLEQAIQSLGVPSDIMLSSYIEEPTLDFLDSVDNESFSTVNLRDFGINVSKRSFYSVQVRLFYNCFVCCRCKTASWCLGSFDSDNSKNPLNCILWYLQHKSYWFVKFSIYILLYWIRCVFGYILSVYILIDYLWRYLLEFIASMSCVRDIVEVYIFIMLMKIECNKTFYLDRDFHSLFLYEKAKLIDNFIV